MKPSLFVFFLFALLLSSPTNLLAQPGSGKPRGVGGTSERDTSRTSLRQSRQERDSVGLFYYHPNDLGVRHGINDTTIDDLHHFDPARKNAKWFANLGFIGSAARPWLYENTTKPGFDLGYHAYDLYSTSPDSLKFYILQRPYTSINYSQGPRQTDAQLNALLTRKMAGGVSYVIDYKRITNISATDLPLLGNFNYDQPGGVNRSLHIGFSYQPEGKRYKGFYSYLANTFAQQETGGLVSDSTVLFGGDVNLGEATVFLSRAGTRQESRKFIGTHYWSLNPDKSRGSLQFRGRQDYGYFRQRYSDTRPDTTFYSSNFLTDLRGLRHYVDGYSFKNGIDALARYGSDSTGRHYDLTVGAEHNLYRIFFDNGDSILQNLSVLGRIVLEPIPNWQLDADALLVAALANAGDYRLRGTFSGQVKKYFAITFGAQSQLTAPSLVAHRASVSQRVLWNNDFNKTLSNQFSAQLRLPTLGLEAKATYQLISNAIYWNDQALPQQSSTPVSILQFSGSYDLRIKGFGWHNMLAWQVSSENNIIRVPPLAFQSNLFGEWPMFKRVLRVRAGVEARNNNTWAGNSWQPVVGQFYQSNDTNLPAFPLVDVYMSLYHKQQFRFFVTYTNVFSFSDRGLYYQTYGYPQPDRYLRLGLSKTMRY